MRKFTVIYEKGPRNWGAFVPDLPGCVTIGKTRAEVARNIKEAIALYLEVLAERGEPIREPSHSFGAVSVHV